MHLFFFSQQVAEVTFNFWYRLSEALYKADDEEKTALFRPYFESLFEALCVHCRLETDVVSFCCIHKIYKDCVMKPLIP